jgi:GGDEF domain-containing protein
MPAAATQRRLLFAAAAVLYPSVFAALVFLERPGYGIGRFLYVAVCLVGLATGPVAGALAGVAALALYVVSVLLNPHVDNGQILAVGTDIRLVTFTALGALVGHFARQHRLLVGHLQLLADRDSVTGLPSSRAFETEITRRLERGRPFAVLLGELQKPGDDELQRIARLFGSSLGPTDTVARVGETEFSVLIDARTTDEAAQVAARLEAVLAGQGIDLTFGWALHPQEGTNALSLCRAADERLYARQIVRGRRLAAVD